MREQNGSGPRARRPSPLAAAVGALVAAAILWPVAPAGPIAPVAYAEWDVDGLEQLLPHQATEAERLQWLGREGEMPRRLTLADPPPLAPIRNCAEWEPCTGVMIRYPLGLPYALLRDLDDDVIIHVVVSSAYLAACRQNLAANGVDTSRVQYLVKPNDSIWTRDYGPWFVFDGNGDIAIIDHVYNRPSRPNDDLIPIYFGEQQGIPVHSHDMWHTGGNYMTDGEHVSMSTDLVYDEAWSANGMTPAEVDQLMEDYYGITTYHVVDDISSSGIHHIDTWAKFVDEETVLIKQVWTGHSTYAALEQRATLIGSLLSSTGRPYRVFRVYCYNFGGGEPASYTNSLLLNRKAYVPLFGSATYDSAALTAYRAAAPGYDVKGYFYSGWLSDDALHCRAMGAADRSMLRVSHVPIRAEMTGPVAVSAFVDDRSETGLAAVELRFRFAGADWDTVPMVAAGGDIYEGDIPNPLADTSVDYYLHAEDRSGRTAGMPRVEPAAWYTFPIRRGMATEVAAGDELPGLAGAKVRLHGNRPNPFVGETTFHLELRERDRVELSVYDVQGRAVRHLVDGPLPAGPHEIAWDGTDDTGRPLSPGIYYYRLRAAGLEYTRPAVLAR